MKLLGPSTVVTKLTAFILYLSCFCSPKDTTEYKMVLAHPAAMCEIQTIRLKNTSARLYRQGEVHVKSVCISELPFVRSVCLTTNCLLQTSTHFSNIVLHRSRKWQTNFWESDHSRSAILH